LTNSLGDKDRIVLYGHSAGSMMVSHLLLSPLAAGKFTGVIGSSGSALAPWATAEENSLPHHLKVAFHAGCCENDVCDVDGNTKPEIDYQKIYQCMRDKPEKILRDALGEYSVSRLLSQLLRGVKTLQKIAES